MSYGYGSHFEGDPAKLSAFIAETRSLARRFKQVANEFPGEVASTSMWPGIDDEYAQEMRPQAEREFEYVLGGLNSVADGFDASTEGHFLALQKIKSTQSENLDGIGELKGQLGSVGEGGGSGGGKH